VDTETPPAFGRRQRMASTVRHRPAIGQPLTTIRPGNRTLLRPIIGSSTQAIGDALWHR
jgi:hypothetical protein